MVNEKSLKTDSTSANNKNKTNNPPLLMVKKMTSISKLKRNELIDAFKKNWDVILELEVVIMNIVKNNNNSVTKERRSRQPQNKRMKTKNHQQESKEIRPPNKEENYPKTITTKMTKPRRKGCKKSCPIRNNQK